MEIQVAQPVNISEIVKAYSSRLTGLIRKRVKRFEDAEDILQDLFSQLTEADRLIKWRPGCFPHPKTELHTSLSMINFIVVKIFSFNCFTNFKNLQFSILPEYLPKQWLQYL